MIGKGFMVWVGAMAIVAGGGAELQAENLLAPWRMKDGNMSVAAHGFGSAAVGGLIYAVGGQAPGPYGNKVVQEYDPATDTWRRVSDMPTARHSLDCAAVDGYVYAIGGHVGNSRAENERYDPQTDTWESMASKPTAVSGPGVAAFGGMIYTFGGNHSSSMQSVIEAYDPTTDTWQSVGNMPEAGEPWDAAVLGDRIYLAGGGGFASEGAGASDHLWAYDPADGTWDTTLPKLNVARSGMALVAFESSLYAIGGWGAAGELASVERWSPGDPSWTFDESLNIPRAQLGAEVVGDWIYAFGGTSSGVNLSSVEAAPEPATLSVLALGGLGLLARRKRRALR